MSFTRQDINTTSTFTTGTAVVGVTTPTFQIWENTSADSGKRWDLGNGWTLRTHSDMIRASIFINDYEALRMNSSGLQLGNLNLISYGTLPTVQEVGIVARAGQDLYISQHEEQSEE